MTQEQVDAFNAAYCMPPRPMTRYDMEYWLPDELDD